MKKLTIFQKTFFIQNSISLKDETKRNLNFLTSHVRNSDKQNFPPPFKSINKAVNG